MGILCPPGWNRVNWTPKLWVAFAHLANPLAASLQYCQKSGQNYCFKNSVNFIIFWTTLRVKHFSVLLLVLNCIFLSVSFNVLPLMNLRLSQVQMTIWNAQHLVTHGLSMSFHPNFILILSLFYPFCPVKVMIKIYKI